MYIWVHCHGVTYDSDNSIPPPLCLAWYKCQAGNGINLTRRNLSENARQKLLRWLYCDKILMTGDNLDITRLKLPFRCIKQHQFLVRDTSSQKGKKIFFTNRTVDLIHMRIFAILIAITIWGSTFFHLSPVGRVEGLTMSRTRCNGIGISAK